MNHNTPQANGKRGLNDAKQPNAIWIQAEGTRKPTKASVHPSPKRKSNWHKRFLLKNKTVLVEVLSCEVEFILNYVQQKEIVKDRDYNKLNNDKLSRETIITKLIDTVRYKGENHCGQFLALLRDNQDIREQFPRLSELDWDSLNAPCSPSSSTPAPSSTPALSSTPAPSSAPSSSTPAPSSSTPAPSSSTPAPSPALEPSSGISSSSNLRLEGLTGYIHDVSAVKRGPRKKYFEAVLQEEKESCRVMFFLPKLQERFAEAERKQTPVKLEKVEPSKNNNGKMLFTDFSKFTFLPPGSLSFSVMTDHNLMTRDAALADLEENKENFEGKRVNVTVEVVQMLKHGHRLTRDDTYLPMAEYSVADLTTDATMTVWDRNPEWEVEVGGWFRVTHVSVGYYRDNVHLNTAKTVLSAESPAVGDLPHHMTRHDQRH